jgi:protoporphyrinogen oxidase
VQGVIVDGEERPFDLVIATLQPPALRHLLPEELHGVLAPYPKRYLGVVCLVMEVRHSLMPYYSVNIVEPTPITTVVETSHVVGTDHTGGNRLLYLPKYCEASAPEHREDPQSIYDRFTAQLARMAPDFDHDDVVSWTVQRAPIVEPVHARGVSPRVAPLFPGVDGLALASASQVYPRLLNGESILAHAEATAADVSAKLALRPSAPQLAFAQQA